MNTAIVFFVLGVLLLYVLVLIWGEHLHAKQDAKDRQEIADLNCSDDAKANLYAVLFREQARRDL